MVLLLAIFILTTSKLYSYLLDEAFKGAKLWFVNFNQNTIPAFKINNLL